MLIAAVDQGSSSTKGAVIDDGGTRKAEVSIPISTTSAGPSVSHRPDEIVDSVRGVLERLVEAHPVAAIALTCQRSTCLIWDRETGKALTPALSWQDTSQNTRIEGLSGHQRRIARITGLRLSPHYAAAKLSALLDELPRGRARAEAGEVVAGTLDAWLTRQLTGRDGTEPGHAGRTLLFDLNAGIWSPALSEIFGVPLAALPPIAASAGIRGEFLGLPVAAIAGDQQAALIGHGGWREGITAVHFGTGAFVLSGTGNRPRRHRAALSAAIASTGKETRYQIEATVNSAGSAVDWARRTTGENLDEWQERRLDPAALPLVFPAFRGAGAPWWRPDARAVISGLDLAGGGAALLGGTLAGVAMRVLDCVELLSGAVPVERLRVSGKLTRLAGLVALLADASGLPVDVAEDEEVGLLGIARLAVAALEESVAPLEDPPPIAGEHRPQWSETRAREQRDRWREFSRRALELDS